MARWSRLVAPDYPMHITQRGHNRDVTFHDAHDFACYREILLRASVRASCAIHAYALMTNHVHLLVTPAHRTGPSRFMQSVGSQYVRYWNKRHRRSGTMWDGRFKSSIVDSDDYFLACCRYIDMNPVHARIVDRADAYEWSSHRHLAYGEPDALLTSHDSYERIAGTPELRQAEYITYCGTNSPSDMGRAIRSATRVGAATGERHFLASLERKLQRPATRHVHGGDRRSDVWRWSTVSRYARANGRHSHVTSATSNDAVVRLRVDARAHPSMDLSMFQRG